ncbi:hypothetical protein CBOM_01146 [Ceraceosorus bombacis]|uniref:Uncharacterized protein n=1 Tax=Ceraceosorus bombacis TaxID=401625 RepID=A0A0P1BCV0_9BASI|nr:hypothetical protein CBOM_01146 [Ceraceosorus bombacis]
MEAATGQIPKAGSADGLEGRLWEQLIGCQKQERVRNGRSGLWRGHMKSLRTYFVESRRRVFTDTA